MRKIKLISIPAIIFVFLFAPLRLDRVLFFLPNARASQEITENETWNTDRTITGEVLLRPGAQLTIKKGVTITFDKGFIRSDRGFLSIEGTVREPVKFKNIHEPSEDNFSAIILENESVAIFKNIEFSGGGFTFEGSVPLGKNPFFNRTLAQNSPIYLGAVDINDSYFECQKCEFKGNINAITIKNQSWQSSEVIVNRSSFEENTDLNVWYDNSKGELDFQYNWWNGNPDKIQGNINTSSYAIRKNFHDPVIIIPGIMGSWEKDGVWQIDPIFHTYDNLYAEFAANGYIPEEDLFTFPYEWRDSNVDSAKKLKEKIDAIKREIHWPKVDIVAHSMGGLLAREYIESNYYENDVDQLITIGTPHLGAPKDYVTWEAGEFLGFWRLTFKRIFTLEAFENGFFSVFQYIHERPISSVQELLPVYNYLYDAENNYALRESYPNNYPRNEFLENLNNEENLWPLEEVEFTKVVGKQDDSVSTISGYNVIRGGDFGLWEHGYPEYFDLLLLKKKGFRYSDGDQTVPLYSAESSNIPADYTIYLTSEHNALPTDAQKDILETLTGIRPNTEVNHGLIHDILFVAVYSPIDIQIESPSREKVGKNFETGEELNEIEGAYYSGFDTNTEFITIPNPQDGEYKIITQGTEEGGDYTIEVAKITENEEDPDNAKESSVTIEGNIQTDELKEAKINVKQDQVTYNPDITSPTITISSPEEKDYTNDNFLKIDYRVEDLESGVESQNWEIEKGGEKIDWQGENIDLSLEHLGSYVFKVLAKDKAGNLSKKEITFQIITNLEAIRNNLNHYYFDLGLIKKKIAYKYLSRKLKNLEKLFDLLEKIENSKLKPKPKQEAIEALKKIINADINQLTEQIDQRVPSWFDQNIADLLAESLSYLKIN